MMYMIIRDFMCPRHIPETGLYLVSNSSDGKYTLNVGDYLTKVKSKIVDDGHRAPGVDNIMDYTSIALMASTLRISLKLTVSCGREAAISLI